MFSIPLKIIIISFQDGGARRPSFYDLGSSQPQARLLKIQLHLAIFRIYLAILKSRGSSVQVTNFKFYHTVYFRIITSLVSKQSGHRRLSTNWSKNVNKTYVFSVKKCSLKMAHPSKPSEIFCQTGLKRNFSRAPTREQGNVNEGHDRSSTITKKSAFSLPFLSK